jgi:sugar/nucleoside kinase (ribokinase family)
VQVSSGQAGYLAFALQKLKIHSCIIGNVGNDLYGKQILDELSSAGVLIDGIEIIPDGQTGITVAIVREDGERAFVSDFGCLRDFSSELILRNWRLTESAGIVCLVGLFNTPKLTLTHAASIMEKARNNNCMTMLDTGWDPNGWQLETIDGLRKLLSEVDIFLPNLDEARAITGCNSIEDVSKHLLELGPKWGVIKCGADGSFLRTEKDIIKVPPRKVSVYDAVGAGDVFNAGFLYGVRQGWELPACMAFGNTASSIYISRSTNRFPDESEVLSIARESYSSIP